MLTANVDVTVFKPKQFLGRMIAMDALIATLRRTADTWQVENNLLVDDALNVTRQGLPLAELETSFVFFNRKTQGLLLSATLYGQKRQGVLKRLWDLSTSELESIAEESKLFINLTFTGAQHLSGRLILPLDAHAVTGDTYRMGPRQISYLMSIV